MHPCEIVKILKLRTFGYYARNKGGGGAVQLDVSRAVGSLEGAGSVDDSAQRRTLQLKVLPSELDITQPAVTIFSEIEAVSISWSEHVGLCFRKFIGILGAKAEPVKI